MGVRIEATTPADLEAVARLLCTAFGAPPNAPFASRDLLRWKYLEPVADRHAPRSHVIRRRQEIAAHCAVLPFTLNLRRRTEPTEADSRDTSSAVSGVCFLDWAGDPRLPGMGIILLKELMASTDVGLVVGGSETTRAVVPKLGFALRQHVDVFARVVRPVRQARSRPPTARWRDGLRLLRNTVWSLTPRGTVGPEWQAVPARQFTMLPAGGSDQSLQPEHGPDYLNYWLRCPAAAVSGFEIRRSGVPVGHFLLSRVGGQSRVADLRLRAESPSCLETAYRLAVLTAAGDDSTCELVCIGSTPAIRAALRACGFRRRGAVPLLVYDRLGVLREEPPLVWSMIDDDTAYVYDPLNPYST